MLAAPDALRGWARFVATLEGLRLEPGPVILVGGGMSAAGYKWFCVSKAGYTACVHTSLEEVAWSQHVGKHERI